MDKIALIGYIAATLTTVSAIPQLIKLMKTKHAGDISMLMFVIGFVGFCLWLTYGILTSSGPLIIANLVTLLLYGTIIYYKNKYN